MRDGRGRVAAVVLAGGSGTRLGAGTNKVYLELGPLPMLAWSLVTLDGHPEIARLVVAVRPGDEVDFDRLTHHLGLATVLNTVAGGATRSASEISALELLAPAIEADDVDVVLIHDGARPFVDADLIDRVVQAARGHGGAVPGLVPHSTVFELSPDGTTANALEASTLRRVQTPQGFAAAPLLDAYRQAATAGFEGVDTAEVVSRFAGIDAVVVEGHPDNLKVTTPADLDRAVQMATTRPAPEPPFRLNR